MFTEIYGNNQVLYVTVTNLTYFYPKEATSVSHTEFDSSLTDCAALCKTDPNCTAFYYQLKNTMKPCKLSRSLLDTAMKDTLYYVKNDIYK